MLSWKDFPSMPGKPDLRSPAWQKKYEQRGEQIKIEDPWEREIMVGLKSPVQGDSAHLNSG